jgi:hypothetical protein
VAPRTRAQGFDKHRTPATVFAGMIPIHYASRALSKTLRRRPVDAIFADDAEALIKRIEDYVQEKAHP